MMFRSTPRPVTPLTGAPSAPLGRRARQALRRLLRRLQRRLVTPALLALAAGLAAPALHAAPVRDRVTLLVPDGADRTAWPVQVWTDSAAEEGIAMDVITDSQLLALGSSAAGRIAGLIVPDSAHLRASAAVVAAIKQYAYLGGRLMLVYDAGVQDERGLFPAVGNSRFAEMTGVDYVFWNNGQGAGTMVGFGPVVGTRARLDSLSLPPGKYMPYEPPASLAVATATTAFVPTSLSDPSGSAAMVDLVGRRAAQAIDDGSADVRKRRPQGLRKLLGIGIEGTGTLRFDRRLAQASAARDAHMADRIARKADAVDARITTGAQGWTDTSAAMAVQSLSLQVDMQLQTISGYGYGPLGYYSYVTTGTFPGQVWLSSPEHGLVAGQRTYGSGQLLFVNLPLGYFKAIGSDGAPLHGFLGAFARDVVGAATVSVQPRARGGLIYNWHIDDGDDLLVNTRMLLDQTQVLKRGPFSLHFTAGPDVINFGDGNGMDLVNNRASQDLVRRLGNLGAYANLPSSQKLPAHQLGSHGGWIHDYWGLMANEANLPDLTSLLVQNFDAIERVTGRRITEYSSPVGNTPVWAVRWMEARGVKAMYLVADLGTGMVRSWRNGQRLTNKLWTSPVSPLGKYATFEEFDLFGIDDATSGQWLLDLQSFVVNRRTNRMFYNHPPGAAGHLQPVNALLARGDQLIAERKFKWYTMTELADFSQRRVETSWSTSTSGGITTFSASHPRTLDDMTWLLPRSSYSLPVVVQGRATVGSDSSHWIVTADGGTRLRFLTVAR
jgi:peptidoglycan/xylan/chitin deacetylase (PgdA/CDA1 family)